MRMDTEADADDRWDCRKEVVVDIFKKYKPAVFGLQVIHSSDQAWAGLQTVRLLGFSTCHSNAGIGLALQASLYRHVSVMCKAGYLVLLC